VAVVLSVSNIPCGIMNSAPAGKPLGANILQW